MSDSLPKPPPRTKPKPVRKKVQPITPEVEESMNIVAEKGFDNPPSEHQEKPAATLALDPLGTDYKNVSTSLNSYYRWLLEEIALKRTEEVGGKVSQRSIATNAVKKYLERTAEELGIIQPKAK